MPIKNKLAPQKLDSNGIKEYQSEIGPGLRLIFQQITSTRAIHCGLICDTGSRDEGRSEVGMAHFIEHMVFKGTKKRKTFQILNQVEAAGGELNAYTTKEKTCLYASIQAEEFDRGMDVLSDIVFQPTFPEKEIEKEKQVISEEIDMYRESPEEAIFEDFDQLVFPSHSLGKPILGTRKSIVKFEKEGLVKFHRKNYCPSNVVLSISGNLPYEKVLATAKKYFEDIPKYSFSRTRKAPPPPDEKVKEIKIAGGQAHCIMGGRAYPIKKKDIALHLLVNYLGGPAGNSRLNMEIRENAGLSYSIYSFFQPFVDTGIWGVYFACEPGNIERIQTKVKKELNILRNKKSGTTLLHRMKRQSLGQLILGNEYPQTLMLSAGKNLHDFGQNFSLAELCQWVEAVTETELMRAANELFTDRKMQTIIYQPEK